RWGLTNCFKRCLDVLSPRFLAGIVFSAAVACFAAAPDAIRVNNSVVIPRITKEPQLEDFMEMRPNSELANHLAKISDFIQRDPKDGAPAMNHTDAYLGYDEKNFYVVFVCFDDQPNTVRSRLARRDNIGPEDDEVQLYLDTFND